MTAAEAKDVLQLKYEPTHFATFDTLQLEDLRIPNGLWDTQTFPNRSQLLFRSLAKAQQRRPSLTSQFRITPYSHSASHECGNQRGISRGCSLFVEQTEEKGVASIHYTELRMD
jgi:hypothetical protein